ncbi:MAG: sigma-70 family RNA polymerase sigma factor [Chitinophagaceae bacterium]|nr:sigma-70 family RNA polymerase sigma factor [Chitinophagaceae bacterium]
MKAENQEKLLLKGLAKNERKAIETIYKENYNMVQALIVNNHGTADDAKDIFQDAMIVLFEKARSANFELNCQIKTYVYAVSRRLWLKRLTEQNKFLLTGDHEEPLVQADNDADEYEQRNLELSLMERAINSVGEPCKSLLEAFYMQKRSMQEIAASFGYTNADNAKTQKYKCLMRLKKLFFTQYKNGL